MSLISFHQKLPWPAFQQLRPARLRSQRAPKSREERTWPAADIRVCLCACVFERATQMKSTFCFALLNAEGFIKPGALIMVMQVKDFQHPTLQPSWIKATLRTRNGQKLSPLSAGLTSWNSEWEYECYRVVHLCFQVTLYPAGNTGLRNEESHSHQQMTTWQVCQSWLIFTYSLSPGDLLSPATSNSSPYSQEASIGPHTECQQNLRPKIAQRTAISPIRQGG